jgi:hypothetical protein
MKNVKLFLSTVVAFLVVGISTVSAQQKQSVIISEKVVTTKTTIEVIKPDYTVDTKDYNSKEDNASVVLKKELDKWLEQGFEIKSTTSVSDSPAFFKVSYVLIKEE